MFKIELPELVKEIFNIADFNGFEIFLVGGCVRDSILGKTPKDYDFCTNLKPEEIINAFQDNGFWTIPTGIKYGTVTIVKDDQSFEITTYRTEGGYSDGRRPDGVEFVSSLEEDLSRRDFTINAMAYNPNVGIIDLFEGRRDLVDRVVRTVGNADDRFKEDFLRAMRAIRFSSQLGFRIDEEILIAINNSSSRELIKNISMERIQDEFCKILLSPNIDYGLILAKLLGDIIPEFDKSFIMTQNNPYHDYTVGTHTILTIEAIKEDDICLKLSAFFHDLGKVYTKTTDEDGVDHFHGHVEESRLIANRVMKKLKFSNAVIDKVDRLIKHHEREIEVDGKSVRKAMSKIGADIFADHISLKVADISAQNLDYFDERIKKYDNIFYLFYKILQDSQCFSLKDLQVNGEDIMIALDMKTGGEIVGKILNYLLELVIDNPKLNEYNILLDIAKTFNNIINER